MAALKSFSSELTATWRLVRSRGREAVPIALVPLIPTLLILPYTVEAQALALNGLSDDQTSLVSQLLALLGIVGFVGLSLLSMAGLFILFGTRLSATATLREAARRFIPYFWTELLVAFLVAASMLPTLLLTNWYFGIRALGGDVVAALTLDTVMAFVTVALSVPALLLAAVLSFAPIAAALRHAEGGFGCLTHSIELVRRHLLPLFKRLFAWVLVGIVITSGSAPLPIASWLLPFLFGIATMAFLVVLSRDLHQAR